MPPMSTEQGLRFSTVINENDHGAYVTIAVSMCLALSLLFFCFRLYTRWPINRLFKWDDFATTASTVIAVCQNIAVYVAIKNGLGQHFDQIAPHHLLNFYKAHYAGGIIFVSSLCLSKLANALLIRRLTRIQSHLNATFTVSVFIVIWGLISIILMAIPCDMALPWTTSNNQCQAQFQRWAAVTGGNVFIEVLLLLLPIQLIWGIQLPFASKFIVIFAFSFRIPVLIMSIFRIIEFKNITNSTDYTFNIVLTEVYAQIELHSCLMAATIPCMRPFLRAFDTGYLGTTVAQVDPAATSTTKGSKGSLYIQSKSSDQRSQDMTVDIPLGRLRPEEIERSARIEHIDFAESNSNQGDGGSVTTNNSEKMIIRKTVDYKVETVLDT